MKPEIYPVPCILKPTSRGMQQVSIDDAMFARRELQLVGEVNETSALLICQQIRQLEVMDPEAAITLYISSPGGSVTMGMAIYDTMQTSPCRIRTICVGQAASMGAVLFVAGDERLMYPHSELMIHDPLISSGASGSALAVRDQSSRLMKLRKMICSVLASHSGRTLKDIYRRTAKDTYISAEEAVKLGFADTIIGNDSARELSQ